MNQIQKADKNNSVFADVRERYEFFSRGEKAQIGKRIGTPEDLALIPAFYKLFPGVTPSAWHYRVAFMVPFIGYSNDGYSLGQYIAAQERLNKAGNLERRILQIARALPNQNQDIIYLRRLMMRFDEPAINWNLSGLAQFFSIDEEKNMNGKKILIEQYFIARHNGKGE